MKQNYLSKLFFGTAVLAAGLFTACSDDYEGAAPYDITKDYANTLAMGTRANLALTYSGDSLIGKHVTLQTQDSKTGTLTLLNVLPHEAETPVQVTLTPDGKGGYSFSGNATSGLKTTFTYKGTVNQEKLSLDLSDVKLQARSVVGKKLSLVQYKPSSSEKIEYKGENITLYHNETPLHLNCNDSRTSLLNLVGMFAGEQVNNALQSISFREDGNIVAEYKKGADWQTSPINLATYAFTDDTTIYVTPNVEMIMRQVNMDKKTRALDAETLTYLNNIYKLLNAWSTTGIKMTLKKNPYTTDYKFVSEGAYYAYAGDYVLYVSKDQLKDILALANKMGADKIAALLGKIQNDQLQSMLPLIKMMLPNLLAGLNDATVFEAGLFLNAQDK